MKNIFESPEVFEAYARIDYCYCMLKEIYEKNAKPTAPIIAAIDAACKYDPTKESMETSIGLLKEIIKSKKIIEADYSDTEKSLAELKKLYTESYQKKNLKWKINLDHRKRRISV